MSNSRGRAVVSRGEVLCPVCGKASYSLGGMHPQCAVALADAQRKKQLCAENQAAAKRKAATPDTGKVPWNMKRCPHCRAKFHVRTRQCGCGYEFFAAAR